MPDPVILYCLRNDALIGVELSKEIVDTLQRLGFEMGIANGMLTARVPWWRDR